MKKSIPIMLIFVLLSTILCSCATNDKAPGGTDLNSEHNYREGYVVDKELYFYNTVYDALKENNTEKINKPNFYLDRESTKLYFTEFGKPQEVAHYSYKLISYIDISLGYPFVKITSAMNANPFSNFNVLLDKKMIVPTEFYDENKSSLPNSDDVVFDFTKSIYSDCGIYMEYNIPDFSVEKKEYPYSKDGCEEFIKSVGLLEKLNKNTIIFADLPNYNNLQAHYSAEDDCYYSYIIYCTGSYSYVTALYFRSSDGKKIDDVTTQLMTIQYPTGNATAGASLSLASNRASEDLGIMSFLMAIEKTLSGNLLFNESAEVSGTLLDKKYVMPHLYEGKNYKAEVQKNLYVSSAEYPVESEMSGNDYFTTYTYKVKLK